MKRAGEVIRDVVPRVTPRKGGGQLILESAVTEAELLAEFPEKPKGERVSAKSDFAAIARASIARAEHEGRAERVERQMRDTRMGQRRGKARLVLQTLRDAVPPRHSGYVTDRPVKTAGNQAARDLIAQLRQGRSVHLYGEPGNTKTHLALWAARCMAKRYGLSVRYLNKTMLAKLAYDHHEPPDFLAADVLLVDDLDKVEPGNFTSPMIATLLGRAELGLTLITTAQRPLEELAGRYEKDERNLSALLSRLEYIREVEVTGPDYRPFDAQRRWPTK